MTMTKLSKEWLIIMKEIDFSTLDMFIEGAYLTTGVRTTIGDCFRTVVFQCPYFHTPLPMKIIK